MQPAIASSPVTPPPLEVTNNSYITAFLLSLFLGGLGVDRFYLGYTPYGLCKLFTLGGFGVWYVVDVLLILRNKVKTSEDVALVGYEHRKIVALITLVITWLSGLIVSGLLLLATFLVFNQLSKGVSFSTQSNGDITADFKGSTADDGSKDNILVYPLGQTYTEPSGYTVSINGVDAAPQVIGDKPKSGHKYVRIDVLLQNKADGQSSLLPGTFFYRAANAREYYQADVSGTNLPGKNVKIANREKMGAVSVAPGSFDNTRSLLFEVPVGEPGVVVWRDGILDTEGRVIAQFETVKK